MPQEIYHLEEKLGIIEIMGSLDLLAHYDPLLKDHLEKVKTSIKYCRLIHHLSSDIQNQFTELRGQIVLKAIIRERDAAIYFGIVFDATLRDLPH